MSDMVQARHDRIGWEMMGGRVMQSSRSSSSVTPLLPPLIAQSSQPTLSAAQSNTYKTTHVLPEHPSRLLSMHACVAWRLGAEMFKSSG
jgi:hypothetical protein